jgi:hypothetical protein
MIYDAISFKSFAPQSFNLKSAFNENFRGRKYPLTPLPLGSCMEVSLACENKEILFANLKDDSLLK